MLFVCTTQGCVSDDDSKGPSLSVGDALPHFSVEMNNGLLVSNNSMQGKVGMIVFFNTGCGDCRKELPVIQQIWDEFNQNPQVVIAPIARAESEEEITDYWTANGFTMPFSPQDDRAVYELFAHSIIPRIYITDKDGVIKFTYDDSEMPSFNTLYSDISSLL